MNISELSLSVNAKTWVRDSHGLYDYESQHVAITSHETRCSGTLQRIENDVVFVPSTNSSSSPLLNITTSSESSGFNLQIQTQDTTACIWSVVRYLHEEKKGMQLNHGHLIKLGRVMYKVKEIQDGSEEPMECISSDTASSEEEEGKEEDQQEGEEMLCRICYEKQKSKDNPLISPCKCDGTVKYLHLNCLKQWIKSKVTTRQTENSVTYQWKTLECDICKLELPLTLKTRSAQVNLFDHDRPHAPFIVLEAYPSERSAVKSMHVIMMTNGKSSIRLGRGHDSDVRINDISVSRCHAIIKFEAGKFIIEDNDSKFGTLVKVEHSMFLGPEGRATVQIGRTLLTLKVQRTSGKLGETGYRRMSVDTSAPSA